MTARLRFWGEMCANCWLTTTLYLWSYNCKTQHVNKISGKVMPGRLAQDVNILTD